MPHNIMKGDTATLGDSTIGRDDLQHLRPGCWLNDRLISVWCEHLYHHGQRNANFKSSVVIFLPNISFFLNCIDDDTELDQISKTYDILNKQLIIAVVNNSTQLDINPGTSQPAGTHWSTLVFSRSENRFFQLDSLPDAPNSSVCRQLASRLGLMLQVHDIPFVTLQVPKQTNGSDCGRFFLFQSHQTCHLFFNLF